MQKTWGHMYCRDSAKIGQLCYLIRSSQLAELTESEAFMTNRIVKMPVDVKCALCSVLVGTDSVHILVAPPRDLYQVADI